MVVKFLAKGFMKLTYKMVMPSLPKLTEREKQRHTKEEKSVFYFGYGSNMNYKTLVDKRKLQLRSVQNAVLDDWALAWNQRGFPALEPVFCNISPSRGHQVHGAVIEIPRDQFWDNIVATEGGGGGSKGYQVVDITVRLYDGTELQAKTLSSNDVVEGRLPSARYRHIVIKGAKQLELDPDYIAHLERTQYAQPTLLSRIVVSLLILLMSPLVGMAWLISRCGTSVIFNWKMVNCFTTMMWAVFWLIPIRWALHVTEQPEPYTPRTSRGTTESRSGKQTRRRQRSSDRKENPKNRKVSSSSKKQRRKKSSVKKRR